MLCEIIARHNLKNSFTEYNGNIPQNVTFCPRNNSKAHSLQRTALIKGNIYTKVKNLNISGTSTYFKQIKKTSYLFKPKRTTSKGALSSGK